MVETLVVETIHVMDQLELNDKMVIEEHYVVEKIINDWRERNYFWEKDLIKDLFDIDLEYIFNQKSCKQTKFVFKNLTCML